MPDLIEIVTKNDVQEGKEYGRLNDLIFHELREIRVVTSGTSDYFPLAERLQNIDAQTISKMLTANEFDAINICNYAMRRRCCEDWTKRLLDANIVYGFQIILRFFEKLESAKLFEIVNAITSTASGRKRSYWAEWVDSLFCERRCNENNKLCFIIFLQQVSKCLGENTAKDLGLHDNGKAITRAFLMCRNENIVRDALHCFSVENQSEFAKCVLDCAPELITELFLGSSKKLVASMLRTIVYICQFLVLGG